MKNPGPEKREFVDKNPLRRKFVARQPIFDREKNVIGYELLFRTGFDNFFDINSDQDHATSKTLLDSFILFGMKELTGGKRGFINFTQKMLLRDIPFSFPRDFLVVELLETVQPIPEIISACEKLKYDGYLLALDDFHFHIDFEPLFPYLDIIKVDFIETPAEERGRIIQRISDNIKDETNKIKFLAEKVETIEDFNHAMELGYTYFQGYFFSRPRIMITRDIPSVKANLLRLLHKIHNPGITVKELERIIKRDVSLSYKLIRFINSASFGLPVEVRSIMHALNLLGLYELRRWVSLLALSQLSDDQPEELMTSSIVRARFCEVLAQHIGMKDQSAEFFLMGLFSLIDTFVERPMSTILDEMPLSNEVKFALLERDNSIFSKILRFVKAYERGDWDIIFKLTGPIGLNEEAIPGLYFATILWANALNLKS